MAKWLNLHDNIEYWEYHWIHWTILNISNSPSLQAANQPHGIHACREDAWPLEMHSPAGKLVSSICFSSFQKKDKKGSVSVSSRCKSAPISGVKKQLLIKPNEICNVIISLQSACMIVHAQHTCHLHHTPVTTMTTRQVLSLSPIALSPTWKFSKQIGQACITRCYFSWLKSTTMGLPGSHCVHCSALKALRVIPTETAGTNKAGFITP